MELYPPVLPVAYSPVLSHNNKVLEVYAESKFKSPTGIARTSAIIQGLYRPPLSIAYGRAGAVVDYRSYRFGYTIGSIESYMSRAMPPARSKSATKASPRLKASRQERRP